MRTSLAKFFSDKFFRRKPTDTDLLQKTAQTGEKLELLVKQGWLNILADEVLDPMQEEAYESFKKLDPQDFGSIVQTQKLGQVIDEIRKRIDRKIELGRQARQRIIELATEEVH